MAETDKGAFSPEILGTIPDPKQAHVGYRCNRCRAEGWVQVPEKTRALDIAFWLDCLATPRISVAHGKVSPGCKNVLVDLTIPIDSKGRYGFLDDE